VRDTVAIDKEAHRATSRIVGDGCELSRDRRVGIGIAVPPSQYRPEDGAPVLGQMDHTLVVVMTHPPGKSTRSSLCGILISQLESLWQSERARSKY
jgi:hypothetical protein